MKKTPYLLAILLICTVTLTACKETEGLAQSEPPQSESFRTDTAQSVSSEVEVLAEQKELYALYIDDIDRMLSENRGQPQKDDCYREAIESIYLFFKNYYGGLQADYNEDGISAFQICLTDIDTEEKQRYECRPLSDGSLWFTYQTESESEKDLPDYLVNEDVLRYSRIDYVYDDGTTDLQEEKQLRRQTAEQYMEEKTSGEVQEFWKYREHVYRVDRNEEVLVDVTEDKESCIAEFLQEQIKRINCQLAVSEDSAEAVEKYKPEGYSLLWGKNAWNDIAVSDLNHDGRMDYVAALYPDDYEEVQRYADWSPYERSSQYYAACFWLLLSSEEGGYEQIQLSDSVEYWENALVLVEVTFVDEGVLQLEYYIGRSPFSNAQLRFRYDEEDKNFYILCSYYRDGYNDALLIGDAENYGRTSLFSYFAYPQNYCEGIWQSADDVPMRDGTMLRYCNDSFQYRCENTIEEHHINSLIWEKEYELVYSWKQYYPDEKLDVSMTARPIFYNQRLVSGQAEVDLYDDYKYREALIPIMIDKQSGEYVTVTGLLAKEDFMQIFADWSADALFYNRITAEEKARCEEVIEKRWEKADIMENYFGTDEEILFLQIVQEGVRVRVRPDADEWWEEYIIDKEYFWGTKVWEYFAPSYI